MQRKWVGLWIKLTKEEYEDFIRDWILDGPTDEDVEQIPMPTKEELEALQNKIFGKKYE